MSLASEILQTLVRIPSINASYGVGKPGEVGELRLAQHIAALLEASGAAVSLLDVQPGRPNLIARFPGKGQRHIGFCAHLDTVPVDGMSVPPYDATIKNGRIYGRGAVDDKASLAAMMAAAMSKRDADSPPVALIFTCDEENGFRGSRTLSSNPSLLPPLSGIVLGEATDGKIIIGHKGVYRVKLLAEGVAAHSSTPHLGVNAIYRMARAISRIEALGEKLASGPSHPLLGRPTLSGDVIHGGQAVNMVPDHCLLELDWRTVPGQSQEMITAMITDALAGLDGVSLQPPEPEVPPFSIDREHPFVQLVHKALGSPEIGQIAYATDASFIQKTGIPTIIWGPGETIQNHKADESIALDDIEKSAQGYAGIIKASAAIS